jgi:hypothetical protein
MANTSEARVSISKAFKVAPRPSVQARPVCEWDSPYRAILWSQIGTPANFGGRESKSDPQGPKQAPSSKVDGRWEPTRETAVRLLSVPGAEVSRGEQKVSRGCLAGEQSGGGLVIDPATYHSHNWVLTVLSVVTSGGGDPRCFTQPQHRGETTCKITYQFIADSKIIAYSTMATSHEIKEQSTSTSDVPSTELYVVTSYTGGLMDNS